MDRNVSLATADAVPPELSQAVARICETEGVTLAQVRSIEVNDDEIGVRIERHGGGSRLVIYPIATLVADWEEASTHEAGHWKIDRR